MRNWDFREFCVRVDRPSPIGQVRVLISYVITPIRGLPNPIRQVVPGISRIRSYSPYRCHLHPPSLSFSSTTLPSSQNTKLSHPSLSLHAIIMSQHRVKYTPSTTYSKYCIIRRTTVSRSQPVSHLSADLIVLNSLHYNDYQLTNEYSLSCSRTSLPNCRLQIDHLQVLIEFRSLMASKCLSKLARSRPPSVSLSST